MKSKSLFLGLIFFLILLILVSGFFVFRYFYQAEGADNAFSDVEQMVKLPSRPQFDFVREEANLDVTTECNEINSETVEIDQTDLMTDYEDPEAQLASEAYSDIYEANPDFVGWVQIPDTKLNYPVMQTVKDPQYYLDRDFEKNYSAYGVPFMDAHCKLGKSNNIIIYGHNMKNGSMFHTLVNYRSESYYKEYSTIYFDTLSDFGEYEIIAAFSMDVKQDLFRYNQYNNMDEERFNQFLSEIESRSYYDTGVTAAYGDELLTLSTCEYTHHNGRLWL